jgi:hypothetical protein
MPQRNTLERARADKRSGKSASTQAGEFVREEIEDIRQGKHGARSAKQAIAIGLSKARRAGVDLKPPAPGKTSSKARRSAARDYARGHGAPAVRPRSAKRSRASQDALKRESSAAASPASLSQQARGAAKRRSPAARSASSRRAVRTKGSAGRATAARKAARTRSTNA